MWKKWRLGLVVLIGLLGLFAVWLAWTPGREDRITWENIYRVQSGMTEAEVEAIFNVPAGNYHREGFMVTPAEEYKPCKLWLGDGQGIMLRFDAAGKVCEKVNLAVPRERTPRRATVVGVRGWIERLMLRLQE